MDTIKLDLSPRTVIGKKVKNLRREGLVPVNFYGRGVKSQALQIELNKIQETLSTVGGNVPINVNIPGRDGNDICFIRATQRHPVSEEILHLDFYLVDVTKTVQANVPIVLEGEAPAVRNLGGVLLQPFNSLEVEALPLDMPESFIVNVSSLEGFESAVRISDIETADGVNILREPEEVIARVVAPRVEEEEEEVVDEELDGEISEDASDASEDGSEEVSAEE